MDRRWLTFVLVLVPLWAFAQAPEVLAAELTQPTVDAFNRYIHKTEERLAGELASGPFLLTDGLSAAERDAELARLRQGEVLIRKLQTRDAGKEMEAPNALIHHWVALVFIPGVSLQQALRFVQDYDQHARFYAPDVVASRLVKRDGDFFHIHYRLRKRKVITVVMNTDYDVTYFPLDARRVHSRSYSTRIAEVGKPGEPDEKEKPVGRDGGFMWRLNTYWRFQEKDGGVYLQCEAVSLTRDIPTGLGWLIRPFISGIPRESLTFTLTKTREGLRSAVVGSAK